MNNKNNIFDEFELLKKINLEPDSDDRSLLN